MAVSLDELRRRVQGFERACRRKGAKVTHQRTEIFREVARSETHPDAETVFRRVRRRVPALSLDTVYRTLSFLERAGLISRVGAPAGRARFDADARRHHHFVCTECGLIRDFRSKALDHLRVPSTAGAFGKVTSLSVQARGICADCLARRRHAR